MFMDMLLKTIPRSFRAGVALVVALLAFSRGLGTIQALLVPGKDDGVIVGCIALIVGIIATVAFYYFQSYDSQPKEYDSLKTLDHYYSAERHKHGKATPVFNSHEGEVARKDKRQ